MRARRRRRSRALAARTLLAYPAVVHDGGAERARERRRCLDDEAAAVPRADRVPLLGRAA